MHSCNFSFANQKKCQRSRFLCVNTKLYTVKIFYDKILVYCIQGANSNYRLRISILKQRNFKKLTQFFKLKLKKKSPSDILCDPARSIEIGNTLYIIDAISTRTYSAAIRSLQFPRKCRLNKCLNDIHSLFPLQTQ